MVTLTVLVAGGMHRSNRANAAIVSFTLVGLAAFVLAGLAAPAAPGAGWEGLMGSALDGPPAALLHATALMFVAYTGYGRIATLGEEVREPARVIPRAIVATLVLTMLLYVSVTAVALSVGGAEGLAAATRSQAAPLEVVARGLSASWVAWVVGAAAVTAMVGVLLNLLLGLSRVALAMGRRGDLPRGLARVDARRASPVRSVAAVGCIVGGLTLLGDVRTTWSFSAFTVLVYYALTNLAALRLAPNQRRFPRWVSVAGLVSCLGLAFWIDAAVWMAGLALLAVGGVWFAAARRMGAR